MFLVKSYSRFDRIPDPNNVGVVGELFEEESRSIRVSDRDSGFSQRLLFPDTYWWYDNNWIIKLKVKE